MKLELYPFQREDVDQFITEEHKAGLFAYEQALGKTLTATTLAVELGTQVNLVVAPQVTFEGWEKAVHTQSEGVYKLNWIKKNTKAGRQAMQDYFDGKPGWYFITWQLLRNGVLHTTHTDMLIGDEIHEIQNKGGSNQNIAINGINAEYKVGLSGTFAGNKLGGAFGTINWLWPSRYKSYWNWLKANFLLAGFGHSLAPIREKTPGMVTGDLPFYVRRLKKDHYADMIPTPHKPVEIFVDMYDKQREIYDQFDATSGAWLGEDEEDGFVYSQYSITKAMRLREIALGTPRMHELDGKWTTMFDNDTKSAKLEALVNLVQQDDETYIVYTHSKKFISVVVHRLEQLGIKARSFTGDLNYRQKRAAINEFGKKFRVLVATQAAIGTGTDGLQHSCSRMVILSRDVKMTTNVQAAERLYRPGQNENVQTWEIIANNSNDTHVNLNLDYAQESVASMLDANTK